MSTIAVAMCRNELDVAEAFVRHMASEVDEVIVLDNGSTDGTREILAQLTTEIPLTVLDDPEVGYYQSRRMSWLAGLAGERGAEWVVPADFDEIWYASGASISTVLAGMPAHVAEAAVFNHYATSIDDPGDNPFQRLTWRQVTPLGLPKVAFWWRDGAIVHQGNHGVSLPGQAVTKLALEIRHFPYRSAEQFTAKAVQGAAAYAATDLPEDQGAHWRAYGRIHDQGGDAALEAVFREHFWYRSPVDSGLVHDPAPYRRWETT
jgi:glycosyltransferase involved in cell wall biosynthesis